MMSLCATNHPLSGGKVKVLIVDDHPVVRFGLASLIAQEPDLDVRWQLDTAAQTIKQLNRELPDICIVDISLEDMSGLDLVKQIRRSHAKLPVLMLSMHDGAAYVERALRAGANGYVRKRDAAEVVVKAIRQVLKGRTYLGEGLAAEMVSRLIAAPQASSKTSVEALSDRQMEIFELIAQGLGTQEIAAKQHLSAKTVESYRDRIKLKLRLRSAAELRQYAIQWATAR